jgi:hypothetical protein
MKTRVILAAALCVLSGGKALHGGDLLKLQIRRSSPGARGDPAVRAVVDASDDNRNPVTARSRLRVAASSTSRALLRRG